MGEAKGKRKCALAEGEGFDKPISKVCLSKRGKGFAPIRTARKGGGRGKDIPKWPPFYKALIKRVREKMTATRRCAKEQNAKEKEV